MIKIYVLFFAVLFPCFVKSDELSDAYLITGTLDFSLAVGIGQIRSPLTDEKHLDLIVLPNIQYYGEKFYLHNTSIGYALYEAPSYSIDLYGRLNGDGVYFRTENFFSDLLGGLSQSDFGGSTKSQYQSRSDEMILPKSQPVHRKYSYMGGMLFNYYGPVDINISLTTDVLGIHKGFEVITEVGKYQRFSGFYLEMMVGTTYKSKDVSNYYYGVTKVDSLYFDYTPGDTLNTHAIIKLGAKVTESIEFVASFKSEVLDEKIQNSPVVMEDNTMSYFVGLKWTI